MKGTKAKYIVKNYRKVRWKMGSTNIWDRGYSTHTYKGKEYIITKLDIDISEEWGKKKETILMTHKIEGFKVPLYMIVDFNENTFGFGYKVVEDGADRG